MKRLAVPSVLLCILTSAGCAHMNRTEPRGVGDQNKTVHDVPVNGWQVEVETTRGREAEGELLAVDEWRIYLLQYEPYRVWWSPLFEVEEVELTLYAHKAGWHALWVLVGLVSTISHGYLALVSAPMWGLAGLITVPLEIAGPNLSFAPHDWYLLRQYARFPYGAPPGLLRHVEGGTE